MAVVFEMIANWKSPFDLASHALHNNCCMSPLKLADQLSSVMHERGGGVVSDGIHHAIRERGNSSLIKPICSTRSQA